jgi:hypothetical protein
LRFFFENYFKYIKNVSIKLASRGSVFNTNLTILITYNNQDFVAQFFWAKFILKCVYVLFIETEVVVINIKEQMAYTFYQHSYLHQRLNAMSCLCSTLYVSKPFKEKSTFYMTYVKMIKFGTRINAFFAICVLSCLVAQVTKNTYFL